VVTAFQLAELAVALSALACALIVAEWTFVILTLRRAGGMIVSGVLQQLGALRTGRGKNPPATKQIAELAARGPAESPPQSPVDVFDPAILDTPLGQDFIAKAAARFGVSPDQARAFAEQLLANGGNAPPLPAGGPPVMVTPGSNQGPPLGTILQGVLNGQIPLEQALMAAAPMFLQGLARNQGAGGGAAPTAQPTGYW
jgi:hypothetical protein